MTHRWQCRYSPTLGALEGTPDEVWGTKPYLDEFQDTVFMGLYSLKDFQTLWNHKGRKAILWCGSDITRFINGWWLDDVGDIRVDPGAFAQWINDTCENYVENGVEHEALMTIGIESKIVPSFLGKVEDYQIEYRQNDRPQVYASVSGDDFALYGWEEIEMIANRCNVDFHLYGNTKPWVSKHSNVIVHGRMPKEQMNEEIRHMQCGLRVLPFDGFSEILAKSCLWGQYPISYRIGYHGIISNFHDGQEELIRVINKLYSHSSPNEFGRNWLLREVNKYPWNNHV